MAKRREKFTKETAAANRVPATIYFDPDEIEQIAEELDQLPRPRPSRSFFIRTLTLEAVEARRQSRENVMAGK